MLLFLIILAILFVLSLFYILLFLSDLEIDINKLLLDSNNEKDRKLKDYLFYVRIKLLGKITWLKIKFDKKKIHSIENLKIFKKFDKYKSVRDILLKNKKEILKKSNIEYVKQLDLKFKELNLYLELCLSNTIFTSFGIAVISSLVSIILAKNVEQYEKNKHNYMIIPKYEERPSVKIELNCIITIKIEHIMNVIYMLIKKRSGVYNERTSNRGSYVCSNDKYPRYG